MRYLVALALSLYLTSASAIEWEDRRHFSGDAATLTLRVLSSTDTAIFVPIIQQFLANNPHVNIDYLVAGSADIYKELRQSPGEYDLVISSAMDLQLKLVNDGYALQVEPFEYPEWAQWRYSLFGFTLEPASIIIHKSAFAGLPMPQSRQELIEVLRANPDTFQDRIGTYDVRQSGLGYLFATQDARASETYWRLMEIMGSLNTKLYCCSGAMIDALLAGEILVAYNVLASYANARQIHANEIVVILPTDFPNVMMRTVLISERTRHARAATAFVQFLTTGNWGETESGRPVLPSLTSSLGGATGSVISLNPALMIFLDRLKRQTFIREWENAVIQ